MFLTPSFVLTSICMIGLGCEANCNPSSPAFNRMDSTKKLTSSVGTLLSRTRTPQRVGTVPAW
ncbi:hypothetical protein TYRP_008487 [Tyrophagus putrescentiae]|nr:hypothetical protein TYRP_008487 [Tyrophagus putrescentiae]